MKKITATILAICMMFMMVGCGSSKIINGKEKETYGIFNKEEVRDPTVKYSLIIGNVVWGIILVETIIAPVYFFGFSIYEPVCLISEL